MTSLPIEDPSDVFRACFENPDSFAKIIKFYVQHEKKIEYATKKNLGASKVELTQRLFREWRHEVDELEDNMFISYINLKKTEETFNRSKNFLQYSLLLKFVLNLLIAIIQAVLIVKVLGRYRQKYAEMI